MDSSQSRIAPTHRSNGVSFTSALTAIILAGGQSSRMGQDKAFIPVQGIPLLRRTYDIAALCTPTVYVVTSRPNLYHPILPPECVLIQECALDSNSATHGPLVGFAQGLSHVTTDWVMLLACDLPYLQATILQRWFSQVESLESEIAILPITENRWEPLCGFYRVSCLPSLQTFISEGGRSFQSWLAQESVRSIVFSDNPEQHRKERNMLFNCNTPEDLQLLHQDD